MDMENNIKNHPNVIAALRRALDSLSEKSDEELSKIFENQELGDIGKFILDMNIPDRTYNEIFGDEKLCECGHHYYRHFDTYANMDPIGCKYCGCFTFEELKPKVITLKVMDENDHNDYISENGSSIWIGRQDSDKSKFGTHDTNGYENYWWDINGKALNEETKAEYGNIVTKERSYLDS